MSQALRTTVNLQTIYPNKGQRVERKIHGKQMNKQHQLWGVDLSCPAPWHRFHTKSQQIEVDMPGVNAPVSTLLPLCIQQGCWEKERENEAGERCLSASVCVCARVCVNEKITHNSPGFIFTESKIAQFEHLDGRNWLMGEAEGTSKGTVGYGALRYMARKRKKN